MKRCGREKEGMKLYLRERNRSANKHFVSICDVVAYLGEVLAHTWSVSADAGHQAYGSLSKEGSYVRC